MKAQRQHILLAEDEENIAFSLSFILERAGYEVSVTADGANVSAMARSIRPELIILDIMLPNRSGFDILPEIRGAKSTKSIPVLVLSAKGQDRDIRRALDAGARAYLTKPFSNAEVVQKVQELLASKE